MRRKLKPEPVTESFYWLELNEAEGQQLSDGIVPVRVREAMASWFAWLRSPAEGLAHARQQRTSGKLVMDGEP